MRILVRAMSAVLLRQQPTPPVCNSFGRDAGFAHGDFLLASRLMLVSSMTRLDDCTHGALERTACAEGEEDGSIALSSGHGT